MAIDSSKIALNENMIFTPGEIVFSIKLYKTVEVSLVNNTQSISISELSRRESLIRHAALIMQNAIGTRDGLHISVDNQNEIRHCGLGSSSSLIAAVATAINELYGNPVSSQDLVRYLAQNHVEEIEGESDIVQQVQGIGGSAASGMFEGGLLIITGQSQVIKAMVIEPRYKVVIGVPEDFQERDASVLMAEEEKNLPRFLTTGKLFGKEIAYRVLHDVLPAMNTGSLKPVGDLIFDYRFNMGSIENCSFTYPKMISIAERLRDVWNDKTVEVLSISSVGPAFFAITENVVRCTEAFERVGLRVLVSEIENDKYTVLELTS